LGDKIKRVHCLFEQSGTFKNCFRRLGYEAIDYDIANDFGETDRKIDLFSEILRGGYNEPSIFDQIEKDDLILAFFPCIRFEDQVQLWFRGQNYGQKTWNDAQKIEYCMKLSDELNEMYKLVCLLFLICLRRGLQLVMENPYSESHYLRRYFCIPSTLIDMDRRRNGDYFKKPTQYWFVNRKPKNNLLMEAIPDNSITGADMIKRMTRKDYQKMGVKNRKVARSMIHPDYADRFIRQYLI